MSCVFFCILFVLFVFFFKQKTAYEMRISDCSSDVCSSDLPLALGGQAWQANGLFDTLLLALGGKELHETVYVEKDGEVAAGPEVAKIFAAAAEARELSDRKSVV